MYAKDAFVRESHRHFSHALAIYPLRQISGKTPQEKACIDRTIAQLESLGTSRWVGFSFVWFALLKIVMRRELSKRCINFIMRFSARTDFI